MDFLAKGKDGSLLIPLLPGDSLYTRISHKKYDHQPPKPYKIWVLTG
jgi:hypothetical protein